MQTKKRSVEADMQQWVGEWRAIERELDELRRREDEEEAI